MSVPAHRRVEELAIRFAGTVPLPSGEPAPICRSAERHVCNAYGHSGAHSELVYREDPEPLSRPTVQAIADLLFDGRPVLDLRCAPEAPLPLGFTVAWLVTYGPVPTLEAER